MEQKAEKQPRVLVIEDDPGHQRLLELYIQRAGCQCDCCFDGRTGLDKALSHEYDAIFIDIHIPEMDGFMVATQIREQGLTVPLIATTALTVEGIRRNASKVGYTEFLQKPLGEKEICDILQRYAFGKPLAQKS
ncbi:MAG TPA: response regulator [Anaerohalosphaeraceae bacterium]|nr:response regulator [Anaerohalosphaeraceae bacterium]HOL30359.1 response regulator [Anaerohalosphaeraceae bacterium]HOM76713.1 response regulator [Anaerohalosphaeraceae bacterium]HPC63057.1 response regulator [Anaerohalosphaeraceae bacterium]HPO69256.1 response regulator [Anaerohalosphaeraceae bacterium]